MFKSYHRSAFIGIVFILLLVIIAGISLLGGPEGKADQEMRTMAGTWAEALKTRDGEPRYGIMSKKMKEQFVESQKLRGEPWNYNIGGSSPWVTDYQITLNGDSAEILYHLTDSTPQIYDKKEVLYFGKENGKIVVVKAAEMISDWERYCYYGPNAETAKQSYLEALSAGDYMAILAETPSRKLEPDGQEIWDTVKIGRVKVVKEDVRDDKACYDLEIDILKAGNSAFEKGIISRRLWLVKGADGWYAEELMSLIDKEASLSGRKEFDKLIYLSPLSSSTFDYAESRMKGTKFTIRDDLFEIDYPDQDGYALQEPVYAKERMTDQMVRKFEDSTFDQVSLAEYKERYQYSIYTADFQKTNFRLYVFDGQILLSSFVDNTADKSEIVMHLWKLK